MTRTGYQGRDSADDMSEAKDGMGGEREPEDWLPEDGPYEEEPMPLQWRLIVEEELPENLGLTTCVEAELAAAPGEVEFPAEGARFLAAAMAVEYHEDRGVDVLRSDHFRVVLAVLSHGAPALLVGQSRGLERRRHEGWDDLEVRLIAPADVTSADRVALGEEEGRVLAT